MTAGTIEAGVAVVMPAFREEANLTGTVEDMLTTLDEMGEQHLVVVVNDGSDDRTGEVADELAARYPGRVHVVHHEVNRGYGAAVRTGIATALEHTEVPWIFLTDSDGQFRGEELPWFLAEARTERADAVIGFRPRRADPTMRKVNAWLWTRASGLLLGVGARDVDCAYKLVGRRVLDGVQLHGDAALISPELLMKIRAREARILQRPVRHYPRVHGEQTGAKLSVILVSLLGLVKLSLKRMEDGLPGRVRRSVVHPGDPLGAGLTALSAVAAIVSCLAFSARHVQLHDPQTARGLLIARSISEGLGPGHAGSGWLPLWHLLAALTAWNDSWFYSGLSGSVISMAAYVFATRYLYLTARALSGNRMAGAAAALAFAADPYVLYEQSTPAGWLLLVACAAAVAYHLVLWCKWGSYRQLAWAAIAALLAAVSSYTGWALGLVTALIVCWVAWRREPGLGVADRLRRTEAQLVFYALPSVTGIAGWLAWNAGLPGHPLSFLRGATAAGFWLPSGASGIGALTAAVVLPAALFTGYVTDAVQQRVSRAVIGHAAGAVLTAAVIGLSAAGGIPALRVAQAASSGPAAQGDARAAAWLRAHYSGGLVLMAVAGNETVLFGSHVPLGAVVSENDQGTWERALANPAAQDIRMIYARRGPGAPDATWLALRGGVGAASPLVRYTLAYADSDCVIYREGELA
jgi:Glycosyl transferase family 2